MSPARRHRRSGTNDGRRPRVFPLSWLGAILTLYLVAPLVASLPRIASADWTSVDWRALSEAAGVSAASATIASGLMAIGGIPLGYWLARRPGRAASAVGFLIQLPLALPPLTSGILLLFLIGPYSAVGRFAGGSLTDSFAGILLAGVFVASPFLIVAARSAFIGVDPILEDVAATLGHYAYARFFRVALPLAWPAIRAGLLLSWLRAFGEFGATVMVAYHPYSLPVYTYVAFGSQGLNATIPIIVPTLGIALLVAVLTAASAHITPWTHRRTKARAGKHPARLSKAASEASGMALPRTSDATPSYRGTVRGAVGTRPGTTTEPVQDATIASRGRVPSDIGNLSFAFRKSLPDFTLDIAWTPAAKRLAILGESGSGKSMTLRLLAGLEMADREAIDGHSATGQSAQHRRSHLVVQGRNYLPLPPEARHIAYVPQDFGLFPHKTVFEQWAFARDADLAAAQYWSAHLGLSTLEDRFPNALSVGQRQRVAIVRALARPCSLILLDEPFSALDTPRRKQLRTSLRRLQREIDATTILVTHDPDEAALLSDELLVLDRGCVLQAGTTRALFARPANAKVAELLGLSNVGTGMLRQIDGHWTISMQAGGSIALPETRLSAALHEAVQRGEADTGHAAAAVMWRVTPDAVTLSPSVSSSPTTPSVLAPEQAPAAAKPSTFASPAPSSALSAPAAASRSGSPPTATVATVDDRTLIDGRPMLILRFAGTLLSVRDDDAFSIDDEVHLTIDPQGIDVWPQTIFTAALPSRG